MQLTTLGFVVVNVATTLRVVADGHVAGETAFVDNNRNDPFDAGKASVVTDANGGFELLTSDRSAPISVAWSVSLAC